MRASKITNESQEAFLFTSERFEDHVESDFRLQLQGDWFELKLVEVSRRPHDELATREQFSLLFSANHTMPQGQYELIHEQLGAISIFLVPVNVPERSQKVSYYEAIFS